MINNFLKYLTLFFILIFTTACSNNSEENNGILINNVWARPALAGNNSAAYFVIENNLKESEKLLSVESTIAEISEIHLSSNVDGVMKMAKQEFVEIKSGSTLEFKPMSYHIMLINLNRDLNVGDQFNLTLNFEKSGSLDIQIEIREAE
jgi:hypothetical protein